MIEHGYRVIAHDKAFVRDHLGKAKLGSAKNVVYQKHLKILSTKDFFEEDMLKVISNDHKTLLYVWEGILVNEGTKKFLGQVQPLKMDDATYGHCAFGLQKNSEFQGIFNHYLQKQIEHGIMKKLYRQHHNSLFVQEKFGINEAQPLAYDNVMFPFILLGFATVVAFIIAIMERIMKKMTASISKQPEREARPNLLRRDKNSFLYIGFN